MSFLKKLFGLSSSSGSAKSDAFGEPVEHDGYVIVATPILEGAQYRLAGTISKEIDGEHKQHKLIRADLFPTQEACSEFTVTKAKQVIKEQGDRIFG